MLWEPVRMKNTMAPPICNKTSRQKSVWESTKRWIQLRSRVKAVELSPSQDQHLTADEVSQGNYHMDTQQLRLFVGTWNVAGKIPIDEWVMQQWLASQEGAEIYVFGFQEIVPLTAGNVFGNDDRGISARKWDELIMKALNESCCSSSYLSSRSSSDSDLANTRSNSSTTAPSSPSSFDSSWFQTHYEEDAIGNTPGLALSRRPINDLCTFSQDGSGRRHSSAEESCGLTWSSNSFSIPSTNSSLFSSNTVTSVQSPEYVRIASRQLVGLYISIWVRRELCRDVKAVDISSVGCGIMGRLGNKGSISVSLSLHETTFCFICSHLKSGDKPNDIVRRNLDIYNILRRTRFHRSKTMAALNLPKNILGHDRIIWFGDLNYRVSLPSEDLKSLVTKRAWEKLLTKDQLKIEQGKGGVLEGWTEGPICFPPTYKYLPNSDVYVLMQHPRPQHAAQKRAPAWCDRILWFGKGLKQLSYTSNSALRQSDHRPVSAMFIAEVETMLRKPLLIHDTLLNKVRSNVPSAAV